MTTEGITIEANGVTIENVRLLKVIVPKGGQTLQGPIVIEFVGEDLLMVEKGEASVSVQAPHKIVICPELPEAMEVFS